MSRAALSIVVFGVYLALTGATLLIAPNALLVPLGFPPTTEVWIRLGALLVLILSYFFIRAARAEMTEFFRWTTHVRFAFILAVTALVLLGLARTPLILLGVADLLGAIWTTWALRADRAA